MSIALTGLGARISTLTGLLVAGGSILLQRQRRSAIDVDTMERELEIRTEQYQAALRHIGTLEEERANDGKATIRRPPQLRAGYFQGQLTRGRGRRTPADVESDEHAAAPA